jgi:hypothetical protein
MKSFWVKNIWLSLILVALFAVSMYNQLVLPFIGFRMSTIFNNYSFFYPYITVLHFGISLILWLIRKIKKSSNKYAGLSILLCFTLMVGTVILYSIILMSAMDRS